MQPKYLDDRYVTKEKLINEGQPNVLLTGKYAKAISYANKHHKKQARKQSNIPYMSHCLAVSALILEAGGDEEQSIAGLLHDVAEDCGGEPRLVEIYNLFGRRVENIVRGCSDSLTKSHEDKAPWKERKVEHLEKLKHSNQDILLVTGADKTHNARAIVTDLQIIGDDIWNRFNAPKSDIIWYYENVLEILTIREVPRFITIQLEEYFKSFHK